MRLSRMLLIAVMAVLASLTPAASPALAQSPSAVVERTVCDRQVCATVIVESPTEFYLKARADYHGSRCGHFEATVATFARTFTATSACIGISPPIWYTGLEAPTRSGSGFVRVRFVSDPPTVGEPIVYF